VASSKEASSKSAEAGGFLLPQKVFNGHLPSSSSNHLPRVSLPDKSVRNLA
jgi:hypothetical protein